MSREISQFSFSIFNSNKLQNNTNFVLPLFMLLIKFFILTKKTFILFLIRIYSKIKKIINNNFKNIFQLKR